MEKYKVVRLDGKDDDPVSPLRIQTKMNEMAEDGWDFVQLSNGGGPGEGYYMPTWVYLVFEARD